MYDGKELMNTDILGTLVKDRAQVMLMKKTPSLIYRLQTIVQSERNRYLDEGQTEITVQIESSEPITLRKYKEIWKYIMGMNYQQDFMLIIGDKKITDDDMVIDDSRMREPVFDVHIYAYLNEDRKAYYYVP